MARQSKDPAPPLKDRRTGSAMAAAGAGEEGAVAEALDSAVAAVGAAAEASDSASAAVGAARAGTPVAATLEVGFSTAAGACAADNGRSAEAAVPGTELCVVQRERDTGSPSAASKSVGTTLVYLANK
jgi:hypothetical protein